MQPSQQSPNNSQQQSAATQLNQPTTSLFMQQSQQSPNNYQQQFAATQINPLPLSSCNHLNNHQTTLNNSLLRLN